MHNLPRRATIFMLPVIIMAVVSCEPIKEAKRLIDAKPHDATSATNVLDSSTYTSPDTTDTLSEQLSDTTRLPNTPPRDMANVSNKTLWKPISEGDGNLVIVTAHKIDLNTVDEITVNGEAGNAYYPEPKDGVPRNGGRGTVRFDNPGAWYGVNVAVRIVYEDGRVVEYVQGDGAKRGELK